MHAPFETLLDGLNPTQREAVCTPAPAALIVAGAGSGKTRVLTRRIAYLIRAGAVSPYAILAVTFTNKAAAEMRERIEHLVGPAARALWVGTFHGLAHRLLRTHAEAAGLSKDFQILDSGDQQRLIKRVAREAGIENTDLPASRIQGAINAWKDQGLRADRVDAGFGREGAVLADLYRRYEQACQRGGLVDFAELLLRANELLTQRADVRQLYHQRFQHVLVDEFQDVNDQQYAWLRHMAGPGAVLFAVGDDDQAIYGWRGARVEHMHRYARDFPGVVTLRLEQNYRSTATILAAANGLIARNESRLGKSLWCDTPGGAAIRVYAAFNEQDEARFVVETAQAAIRAGTPAAEVAILYRSNAQSRAFEEALVQRRMPYRVYGGQRFFERAEIKDALAYLRLIENPHDDASLDRVINHPPRGIGARTLQALREASAGASLVT